MSFCIVQISDIHFRSAATVDAATRAEVTRRLRPIVRGVSKVLIAVTGDIAYAGQVTEYDAAFDFLSAIKGDILAEGCADVEFITVPGNHDCDMTNVGSSRALIADSLIRSSCEGLIDQGVIDTCISVQAAYRNFSKRLEASAPSFDDGLFKEHSFKVDGRAVTVYGLNVAWLSKIKEKYGELMFPIKNYEKRIEQNSSDLNIVLMHHPANWMIQNNYQALRSVLKKDNTLILSGHEHCGGGYQVRSSDGTEHIGLECLALVPEKSGDARGFTTLDIDMEAGSGLLSIHSLGGNTEVSEFTLSTEVASQSNHQLSELFLSEMSDPGGNFSGLSKANLSLIDIFTYPDVKAISDEFEAKPVYSAKGAIENQEGKKKIIFYGRDLSGKTTLLFQAFKNYYGRGMHPIYVHASIFNNSDVRNIKRKFEEFAKREYKLGAQILQEPKDNLVLLLDDIEELLRFPNLLKNVLKTAGEHFGRLVITAEQGFNITELVDGDVREALSDGHTYELLQFGHKNRYELIKKWCRTTGVIRQDEMEKKIHFVETTLNTVIGRNLTPSYPLYILMILQSMEDAGAGSLQNSSYAHYYQYLITKGLNEAGLKKDRHDEVMNYLGNLAWFFRSEQTNSVTEIKLQGFNQAFGAKYHNVVLTERLQLLVKARLLAVREGIYSFSYPYIYHFFLGAYLSTKPNDAEVIRAIDYMCANLRDRESAHTILFLTHHNKSSDIIQKIESVLDNCFREHAAFTFEADAAEVDNLISSTSQRSLENLDVEENRVAQRRQRDINEVRLEANDARIANDASEIGDRLREMQSLFRTGEIVGQILKNYYGSLERDDKQRLLKSVFAGPMRLMGSLMAMMENSPMLLADSVAARLKEDYPQSSLDERKIMSKRIAFDFLGMISFGLIIRPARDVSIDELDEDIAKLVESENITSLRLAQVASWLVRPGVKHTEQIKKLAGELKDKSPFAYTLLQSLGVMHLRMFNMAEVEKQRFCSALNISFLNTKKKEIGSEGMKKLK